MKSILFSLGLLVSYEVSAQSSKNKQCHKNKGVCDKWSPCCSTSGWCGNGHDFCGVNCFEPGNFGNVKCTPKPQCKSQRYTFKNNRIVKKGSYKGNYKDVDFTVEGNYEIKGDEMILKMSKPKTGTTLSSTRFMNYGEVTAVMKSSRSPGVVSSFITMSDSKDEIDFEWLGGSLNQVETNWYSKGVFPVWPATHGGKHPSSNSHAAYHRYTIRWRPSSIKWLVDGKTIRELPRVNGTGFPNTASRISIGLWDGGSGAEGTRQWAGGYVNWKAEDMVKQGYFDVRIKSIEVKCLFKKSGSRKISKKGSKKGLKKKNLKKRK